MGKAKAISLAAGLVTQTEDSKTYTALYNLLDGKQKLYLETQVAAFLQAQETV